MTPGGQTNPPLAVVVMAAGQGTRMKSKLPKALHRAAGRSLLEHVLRATAPLNPEHTVIIIGYGAEQVKEDVKNYDVSFVLQDFDEGYGTGMALKQAERALPGFVGNVMALNGDGPLLKTETLAQLVAEQGGQDGMTLVTCLVDEPTGMGRIIRDATGNVDNIVEEKEATPDQKHIKETNPGIYLFDATVFDKARRLSKDNAAGEYYITDLPRIYLQEGSPVRGMRVEDETEVLSVNDRKHLTSIERILRERIRDTWLAAGVTMISPETTFIDDTVFIEPDVVLEPGVILKGETRIGEGATVGAYAYLQDAQIAEGEVVPPHTVRNG